ncbi:hypothetical protein BGW36DRAFT_374016 [Talaromyces proteolyticus]|uniref:DUF1772-domain-containing protein n=1 Tax=Talaromyces proteolyticus TaxID=1131652 RepID=A0AAD4KVL0_9EURO|nr:uncharacterized protein BGW36DRAFT_374016 [Talaromyces proteolyticus]KAH8700368.1 hypothetical protein BGW36DRAFT_374016 [Talaromyces proteolyticus]
MSDSTLVKAAQVAATLAAAAASGGIISISVFTIPAIAQPSRQSKGRDREKPGSAVSHVAQQWEATYDLGKVVFPSIALASSLLYSYVAYAVRDGTHGRRLSVLYLTAAGLVVMIAPITGALIVPVNNKLHPYTLREDSFVKGEANAEERARHEHEDHEFSGLLRKWSQLNLFRGLFPLFGATLGATAAFGLV